MAHLEHLFAAGIRFDTEVQYLAQGANGLVYEDLPIRKSASPRTLTSIIQCLAILNQLPRTQVRGLGRAARRALHGLDDDSLLRCIEASCANVVTELHSSDQAKQFGAAAVLALRSDQVCLLQFESSTASRWATVIGVELDRATGEARALLLLDTGGSEPWACSHNARIELQAVAGRAVRASVGFTLNCRHLTGEACAVRLLSLIALSRNEATDP